MNSVIPIVECLAGTLETSNQTQNKYNCYLALHFFNKKYIKIHVNSFFMVTLFPFFL